MRPGGNQPPLTAMSINDGTLIPRINEALMDATQSIQRYRRIVKPRVVTIKITLTPDAESDFVRTIAAVETKFPRPADVGAALITEDRVLRANPLSDDGHARQLELQELLHGAEPNPNFDDMN